MDKNQQTECDYSGSEGAVKRITPTGNNKDKRSQRGMYKPPKKSPPTGKKRGVPVGTKPTKEAMEKARKTKELNKKNRELSGEVTTVFGYSHTADELDESAFSFGIYGYGLYAYPVYPNLRLELVTNARPYYYRITPLRAKVVNFGDKAAMQLLLKYAEDYAREHTLLGSEFTASTILTCNTIYSYPKIIESFLNSNYRRWDGFVIPTKTSGNLINSVVYIKDLRDFYIELYDAKTRQYIVKTDLSSFKLGY